MYKKYFGKLTEEMFEMGVDESPFQDAKGNEYEFEVQFHSDGNGDGFIRITDSIGRMVPVDCSHIRELIMALQEVEAATSIDRFRNAVLASCNW